jgi:hypothetical protein
MSDQMIKALKTISGVSGGLGVCLWWAAMFLWQYFDAHESRVPQPGSGQIYRLFTHGSIVYLTSGEHHALDVLMFSGMGLLGIFALTAVFYLIEKQSLSKAISRAQSRRN